ncbi:MAG: thiamine pyrophosphate-binding protein [Alphaproteobacteria bacterium]|nr:MAG: thiamine pyrophosphate-binding protein [Alphaproteobacteria bacterium]
MATTSDLVARALHAAGCRHAFGIPGGEVLSVMHALAEAGIAFHLCKHENAGGFMAEGTYHVTGAPGILVATLGPGVANAVNVVANAWQDRVPLIFLTGCVDAAEAEGYTHQVFEHRALLAPITKGSFVLSDGAVDTVMDKAVALATEGRPGPVHIDVPVSLADREQPGARCLHVPQRVPTAPAPGPALAAARRHLATARRPILIAGLEVLSQKAEAAVADFARRFAAPVITTYKAKGVVPEDDPLALGGAGLSPLADKHLLPLVQNSDLILLAGYDPIEMRHAWCEPWDPDTTPVIELTVAPHPHGVHRASQVIVGDIAAGLAALGDGVAPSRTWPDGAPAATRAALAEAFRADAPWGAAAVIDEVRRALPEDGIATVDSGAHRILLSQVWRCTQPRTLLQSTALCTMGCALPLAIGAKLAAPRRPVVAFTGDAGLEMVLGELATLRDLALPVVVVVFVDASLALIELKQRRAGRGNLGVDFGATDFAAVARALGGRGVMVEDRAALRAAVVEGLGADTFTVVGARIGRGAYDGTF